MIDRPRVHVDFNDDEVGGVVPVSRREIERFRNDGWSVQSGLKVVAFMEGEVEADGVLNWSASWNWWMCDYDIENVRDISPDEQETRNDDD